MSTRRITIRNVTSPQRIPSQSQAPATTISSQGVFLFDPVKKYWAIPQEKRSQYKLPNVILLNAPSDIVNLIESLLISPTNIGGVSSAFQLLSVRQGKENIHYDPAHPTADEPQFYYDRFQETGPNEGIDPNGYTITIDVFDGIGSSIGERFTQFDDRSVSISYINKLITDQHLNGINTNGVDEIPKEFELSIKGDTAANIASHADANIILNRSISINFTTTDGRPPTFELIEAFLIQNGRKGVDGKVDLRV
ncbi:hypothetical protein [Sphingomonas sp.]|uniref:hypothetical protein n=1 Tax=Sphingomonas sp. TaxID=28214 RepID=UPI003564FAA1